MGSEIAKAQFGAEDFEAFQSQLEREMALLRQIKKSGGLSNEGPIIGLELEAWLIDHNFFPAPHNQSFLDRLGGDTVVAELSRFNIEIITPVEEIAGEGLGRMYANVSETMRRCASNANEDVAGDFFERDDDSIRLTREVVPAMLTTQERIIRQDCLCYLMEELSP